MARVEQQQENTLEIAGIGTIAASLILAAISILGLREPGLSYGPLITLSASGMSLPVGILELYFGSKGKNISSDFLNGW